MKYGKTEVKGFYKTKEGFLINEDKEALAEYKASKMKNIKLNNIEKEMGDLRNELSEIKELLRGLVK